MTTAAPLTRYGAHERRASRAAPLPPASYTTSGDTTLYNTLFYRRLGYFDTFEPAMAALKEDFAAHGFEVSHLLHRWREKGAFTYSVNHPKPYVVADIAYEIARKAGLETLGEAEYSDFYPDTLCLYAVYPVFPELARHLKLGGGSYVFKRISGPLTPRILDLDAFVRNSAEILEEHADEIVPGERLLQAAAMFRELL